MAANRHTYIHTHNFRKCSHASVGLAEARPNYFRFSQKCVGAGNFDHLIITSDVTSIIS